jgi:hypothetical protein
MSSENFELTTRHSQTGPGYGSSPLQFHPGRMSRSSPTTWGTRTVSHSTIANPVPKLIQVNPASTKAGTKNLILPYPNSYTFLDENIANF